MTLLALLFNIALGVGSLAWGYAQIGLLPFARWMIFLGAAWLLAIWRRWRWFGHAALGVLFLAAALGLWILDLPPGWMLSGAIGGVLAFDLSGCLHRLRFAASDEERRAVERRHLARTALLTLFALGVASWMMLIKSQFNREWVVFLALAGMLALFQLVPWFRR